LRAAHAIISTGKNAKPWKANRCGGDTRNDILRPTKRVGRAIWKRWSGYHRRSLVETKMRCFKLLGERVMARDFDRQVAELQVRAAVLNRFTRLDTDYGLGVVSKTTNSVSSPFARFAQQSQFVTMLASYVNIKY